MAVNTGGVIKPKPTEGQDGRDLPLEAASVGTTANQPNVTPRTGPGAQNF